MIREHKIPTLIGLFVLVVGLVAGIFLVQSGQVFFLKASPEITPTEVKITNVSDNAFSVSWITQKETSGFVQFGQSETLDQTQSDDRDQISGGTGNFNTHHITLKNLSPKTQYYFKIGSGGRLFDNSGKPYEITTASTPKAAQVLSDVASGIVLTPDKTPAEGAVVYLSMANMTPQSALMGSSGNWMISLSTAFSGDLSGLANYDLKAQTEEIFVQAASLGTATAIVTTENDNPVPELILGQTYDFRQNLPQEGITPTPGAATTQPTPTQSASSKFSFTDLGSPTLATETAQLKITNPDQEGEKLNTPKPEFTGTGPAGKTIQILIESPKYNGTTTVEPDGTWSWSMPTNLTPGEHKITITYLGKSITRTFTVLAAGESELPAFTATPSATLTPTQTPTPTRTPTATPTPKLTPTLSPTQTASPSARTTMPATGAAVPQPGNLTPTLLVFIMGLTLILSGLIIGKVLSHER